MNRYQFQFLHADHPGFEEKDHVFFADSLSEAIRKFERKHDVEAPAYWDEPAYDRFMEICFKSGKGLVKYLILW